MKSRPYVTAIIVAAGSGTRFSATQNKLLYPVNGQPLIQHTIAALSASTIIDEIIIVGSQDTMLEYEKIVLDNHFMKVSTVVLGGDTRSKSVEIGLGEVTTDGFVAIHDGARPFVSAEDIDNCINAAFSDGCATLAVAQKDALVIANQHILQYIPREKVWCIQTPQVFPLELLRKCYRNSQSAHLDDAGVVMEFGHKVTIVKGNPHNIKITTAEDI